MKLEYQAHFAEIAEKTGCGMFVAGCEMVMSERREDEWRKVIERIRSEYGGLVSYNTDKYQEHNVKWWDAVDVISSSGYYPIDTWEKQLDRIENVVKKYKNPFFFGECGCKSCEGANLRPNDWTVTGETDLQGQADWYRAMFQACEQRDWFRGFSIWQWRWRLSNPAKEADNQDFTIYLKPA